MQYSLSTRAPFNFEATIRALQRRPVSRVDLWEGNCYLRVLPTAQGCALVEVRNAGTIDKPNLTFRIRAGTLSASVVPEVRRTLHRVLGLGVDPGSLRRVAESEPVLRPTAVALRGLRPPRFVNLFEAFARVVPFQQLSLDAGVAIVGRLVARFGEPLQHDGRQFHAFPTALTVARGRPAALRACGLSSAKAETLRHVARVIDSGDLVEQRIASMATRDALEALIDLPGIGPWSASVVLLRGLGRLDVFPPNDVGALRGLSAMMQARPGAALTRVIERFGDLRGYLYFLALGDSLLKKGLIHAQQSGLVPSPPYQCPKALALLQRDGR
jgi:DNA-3-methyladenine glycosylase II